MTEYEGLTSVINKATMACVQSDCNEVSTPLSIRSWFGLGPFDCCKLYKSDMFSCKS